MHPHVSKPTTQVIGGVETVNIYDGNFTATAHLDNSRERDEHLSTHLFSAGSILVLMQTIRTLS
jgi:hypothetical protein